MRRALGPAQLVHENLRAVEHAHKVGVEDALEGVQLDLMDGLGRGGYTRDIEQQIGPAEGFPDPVGGGGPVRTGPNVEREGEVRASGGRQIGARHLHALGLKGGDQRLTDAGRRAGDKRNRAIEGKRALGHGANNTSGRNRAIAGKITRSRHSRIGPAT